MREEFTTMAQVTAELGSIRQMIEARDQLDAERRKVDDARNSESKQMITHLLDRADGHGGRIRTLEVNWAAFFSENGAFTYVKKKIEATDKQNRWIIALAFSTLVGVIVNLMKH